MNKPSLADGLMLRSGHYPVVRTQDFLFAYANALLGFSLSVLLSVRIGAPLFLIAYPLIGLLLSRFATRQFEAGDLHWNWHMVSMQDLIRAKTAMLMTWPFSFPGLIWKIFLFRLL